MYLKNLLNTNYFLFEDLYRLFDRVLYENTI